MCWLRTHNQKDLEAFMTCFFFSRIFAAISSQGAVFFVSFQALGLFFILASLQMCKIQRLSPNTKSTDELGWMGEEAAGVCGVWWELCEEVTEGWRIAIEIMMGWIFEKEAGCKCRECCVGEESCPAGDEGGGSGMAQRCWSVTCFGSGEVGDLGFPITTFCPVATSWKVDVVGSGQRLVATLFPQFLHFDCWMIAQ